MLRRTHLLIVMVAAALIAGGGTARTRSVEAATPLPGTCTPLAFSLTSTNMQDCVHPYNAPWGGYPASITVFPCRGGMALEINYGDGTALRHDSSDPCSASITWPPHPYKDKRGGDTVTVTLDGYAGGTRYRVLWNVTFIEDPRVWTVQIRGQSVVRDCDTVGSPAVPCPGAAQLIHEFAGNGCPATHPQASWRDCTDRPDGTPEKLWPLIAERGKPLTIALARFRMKGTGEVVTEPKVKATATRAGGGLTFKEVIAKTEGDEIVVANLVSNEPLSDKVAVIDLNITWQVTGKLKHGTPSMVELNAGRSLHRLYVTFKPFGDDATPGAFTSSGLYDHDADPATPPTRLATVPVRDQNPARVARYLSVVDLSTWAAQGAADEQAVVDGVWNWFRSLNVTRRDLDPHTGAVTHGRVLRYYPDWTLAKFLNQGYPDDRGGACATLLRFLNTGVGRCGNWAHLFAFTLAAQGISTTYADLRTVDEWQTAIEARFPRSASFMLVGSANWTFGPAQPAPAGYPFQAVRGVRGAQSLRYAAAAGPVAQGTKSPPGMFEIGDHALVRVLGKWYDPSYGQGGFPNLTAWVNTSVVGYGTFDPTTTTGRKGPFGCLPLLPCTFSAQRGLS